MELAQLKTHEEQKAVVALAKKHTQYLTSWNHVDGMSGTPINTAGTKNEYFFEDGTRFAGDTYKWFGNFAFNSGVEKCMSLSNSDWGLNDIWCSTHSGESFICQDLVSF
jgi:hypothetical protein